MSLSGMFNIGHDVGGFAGPPPGPELLIRWTQAGLLHPRFLMNSWKDDGVTTSPWLHPEALPAIREALRLALAAYALSLQRDGSGARGPHPCAGADLHSPSRTTPPAFADADAAMFGPSLLAAPVLREGAREVEVYLPAGVECWRDFWTGRVYAAGLSATIAAPLDRLPLIAPAGAIVATTDSGDDYLAPARRALAGAYAFFRAPARALQAPRSSKTMAPPSSAPRPG